MEVDRNDAGTTAVPVWYVGCCDNRRLMAIDAATEGDRFVNSDSMVGVFVHVNFFDAIV